MSDPVLIRQIQGSLKNALSFGANWGNYGGALEVCTYSRMGHLVILQGLATKSGTPAAGDVIGTLPENYWPGGQLVFAQDTSEGNSAARVDVLANGQIVWKAGGTTEADYTTLSGICFVVD